ncbi:MAG: dinitrogenase iron-molybdenum cofactor biosynthesis protein [Bacteroidetes bacterium]|jgi:predicted Fe-Mo cluster-binding NifX family protein|nr:dinitrogenase iron-molybdenum cofactor biosynthesis protein [Bacteroidota bacterium]MBT4408303.1 dinitrogenase iron-molybdenum cofactor biosynthesis protein [Bacteroidota bacterium]MBT5426390.1 dinitrogenase iron-molybdenum cofactor biosynthesis protein [Bacteroidota bacterium]MBT7093239.1 dinitrogenase iron-molybdenum cofactor biosynthesis protein [Bacteroidota bacterium]MBT7465575.1 dinitrogenase iron-molybdenum cofactor biosynthesis protein [Bacteroidota bacterium]
MKIAIPTRNNQVDAHFGHCEYYTIFIVEDQKILSVEPMQSPEGCGCKSDIANTLMEIGVSLMLAGNMGAGALHKLNSFGIEVVRGCSGNVEDVVNEYLKGQIQDSGQGCSQHEQHHGEGQSHGHSCN